MKDKCYNFIYDFYIPKENDNDLFLKKLTLFIIERNSQGYFINKHIEKDKVNIVGCFDDSSYNIDEIVSFIQNNFIETNGYGRVSIAKFNEIINDYDEVEEIDILDGKVTIYQ